MLKSRFASARANSLRGSSIAPLLLTALLALSFGLAGHTAHKGDAQTAGATTTTVTNASAEKPSIAQDLRNIIRSAPVVADTGAKVAAAIAPQPLNVTRETELDEGQTFSEMLTDQGVDEGEALAAANALSKVYDMHRLRAGQDFTLSFSRTNAKETLSGVTFQPEDTKEIELGRVANNSFAARVNLIPITRHRTAAAGEIRTTLYEAGDRAGVSHALMATLIRIYSHSIDFQHDIHPGDRFEILFDQSKTAKGKPVGDSTIVYAVMRVDGKDHALYRVTFNDGTSDYFDERGQTVRRALLRTPVAAAHITSGFGMRIHPLLGYSKMHKGTDFGAPTGAPIFAAGAGTIDEIGFKGGYGRYIRIRHSGNLATAYGHMSRFSASLYPGARVNQGQVIGYVGMSGRATGPHLHFEVLKNGQQVNPMSVNAMPTGRTLDGKMMTAFRQGQGKIKQEFKTLLAGGASMTPASANTSAFTPKASASH